MEENLKIEELKRKYQILKANVYDYSEADKGKEDSDDFKKFREVICNFENSTAPDLDLFPKKDSRYWVIKSALITAYAGFKEYKENYEERMKFMIKLLITHGFDQEEIKDTMRIIEGKCKDVSDKDSRLEGITRQI